MQQTRAYAPRLERGTPEVPLSWLGGQNYISWKVFFTKAVEFRGMRGVSLVLLGRPRATLPEGPVHRWGSNCKVFMDFPGGGPVGGPVKHYLFFP